MCMGSAMMAANIWIATGDTLNAIDPASGKTVRKLDVPAHAGTAFDGQHLFQISGDRIQKVDPDTGRVVATIPTPEGGASGMAWAEGTLWVGQHRKRKIHQVDPQTGAILRTIEFEPLRHRRHLGRRRTLARHLGSREKRTASDRSAERRGPGAARHASRVDRVGLESNGSDTFFCGGGSSGKVRAVRRPARGSAAKPQTDGRAMAGRPACLWAALCLLRVSGRGAAAEKGQNSYPSDRRLRRADFIGYASPDRSRFQSVCAPAILCCA